MMTGFGRLRVARLLRAEGIVNLNRRDAETQRGEKRDGRGERGFFELILKASQRISTFSPRIHSPKNSKIPPTPYSLLPTLQV
jgi:hypothetical protein